MGVASHRAGWALPALLLVAGGCAPEPEVPETPASSEASERPGLAIPHPPLDDMEPAVALVLEAQRAEVDALFGRLDVPAAERARALGRLGQLYQAHRLVEASEACYRQAHALDPERFEWAYYSGVLAGRRGRLDDAAAAFRRAIDLRPSDLPALVRLADLELDRGEIDAAHDLYSRARSLDPALAAAEYGLGRVAAARRSYEQAARHFERALELQPRASVIQYHLGQAYRQLGDLDRASRHLSESGPVEVAISDPLMSAVNALATGAAPYLVQGNAALRDGRLSVAADAFRRAIEADPEHPRARQSLATVLTLLRDAEGAVEQLEAAARLAPDNARAQADLGTALAEQGHDERALEHLERAVALEPSLQEARFNLASTLARLGRFEDAARHYRLLLEIDPNHVDARSRLGTALAQAGKPELAIDELTLVARQDPGDEQARLNLARAHFNLGTAHLRRDDLPRALEHLRQALEVDDRLAPAHLSVANLLAVSGRLEEALPHFVRVRELDPDHPTARLGEATALMFLGRFADAETVLEDAVRRLPEESASAHALARLLAAAPDPSQRDGERALVLASRVLEDATVTSYVETQAMALAEVGRFRDAAARQRAVLTELERGGRAADARRVARNLARYEHGMACCADPTDVVPRTPPSP